jgi:hypothetical protein
MRPAAPATEMTRRRLRAVLLVTALVAACGTTVSPPPSSPSATVPHPSATPAASPSPTSGPSLSPTPAPSSSAPVTVDEGMPVEAVPTVAIRMSPIPDSPGVHAGGTPTGPYAYLQGFGSGLLGSRTLYVADAGGGSERAVPLPLAVDEQIDEVRTDGSWIIVAVSRLAATSGAYENGFTCTQQEHLARQWRILAAPLGADGLPSGTFRRIDWGEAARAFELPGAAGLACPYPATPPVAVAAGRVAYAVEAGIGARSASTVVVRSLPTGTLIQTYASPLQVYQIALSSTAVAWSETANGLTDGPTPDWRVMIASITTGSSHQVGPLTPHQVPLGVVAGPAHETLPSLLLDGNAVIASLDQFTGARGTVVRVVGDTVETVDPGHPHRDCGAGGADGGVIVLYCNGTTMSGDTATLTSWVAVWSAASGLRALGGGAAMAPGELWTANGWAVWTGVDANQHGVLMGVPLSATTSASQTRASDAATARSLVARYEAASAAGDDATAWSLLAPWSRDQFPTRQSFADSRRVAFGGAAAAYDIGEPRTDDPSIPGWLAKGAPGVSDPGRVFSVEVTHPNASPATLRLELFFVALDMSGTWKVWAVN